MGTISTTPILIKSMLPTLLAMTIDIHSIGIGTNLALGFDPSTHGFILAQQFQNVDILGNIQSGWADFLKSGKAGTFTIGLVLGYVVRGITR